MKQRLNFFIVLVIALLISRGANAYDFSAVAPSGQTLYYNIVNGNAEVTYQNVGNPNYSVYPAGSLTIPGNVIHNDTSYAVTSIGIYAFRDCDSLTSVTIPDGITSIGYSAFSDCSHLTTVTIPNSVTSIGVDAFSGCSGLTSVTIPNGVTLIADGTFGCCRGLTSVTIPSSVTSIGDYAFTYCTSLTSADIPYGGMIGYYAFSHCTSLATVSIGGAAWIGNYAFYNCDHLMTFICKSEFPQTIGPKTFENIPQDCMLIVPCGSMQYYLASSSWHSVFSSMEEDCGDIEDAIKDEIRVSCIDGRIYVEGAEGIDVKVYDLEGRIVRNESLPIGVYLVKIGNLPTRRVVVLK